MANSFEKNKSRWIDQFLADRELLPRGKVTGAALSQFLNRTTFTAYPSGTALAVRSGQSLRTVRSGIDDLVDGGHLERVSGRGRKQRNVYRPILIGSEIVQVAALLASDENVQAVAPLSEQETVQGDTPLTQETDTVNDASQSKERCKIEPKIVQLAAHRTSERTTKGTSERDAHSKPKRERGNSKALSTIPPNRPNKVELERAFDFFVRVNRLDLADRVELIAVRFRNHHQSEGTEAADWGAKWTLWCSGDVERTKIPIDYFSEGWDSSEKHATKVRSIVAAYRPSNYWPETLGPPPDVPGCQIDPKILRECGWSR